MSVQPVAARVARIIVTKSVAGGPAYGVTTDTGENVYIPQGIAGATRAGEFDKFDAVLTRNERSEPPWKVIHARQVEAAETAA